MTPLWNTDAAVCVGVGNRISVAEKDRNLSLTTFGRYALLEKIGSGGMAEIYRAKTFGAAGFEKEFAIKLILPSLVDDKEFVEMFINEAKITVSLYHANVVQVFDLGELDGQYYIAMEFVNGMDLLDVLARCASMDLKIPFDLVLFLTMEMLKGLDFAHRAKDPYGEDLNIIHRDVSPSNVLISYAGDVKIGDFGVAKAATQKSLTETGTLKGKVGYMSPEQVIGDEIDWRSDIFAAGIVFFEALAMNRLFVGGSDLDVMLRVRDADIDASLADAGPMPSQLEDIVRRAMSKHREERFQTAGEFYQALVDFCYRHRIKVTGQDLSNFMRRLFAEEIEAAKARRLNDLDGHEQVIEQLRSLSETSNASNASSVSAVSSASDSQEVQVRTDDGALAVGRFRYRDPHGLVYGPLDLETLIAILSDRHRRHNEFVCKDNGQWIRLSESPAIMALLDGEDADVSSALEEISLAAEVRERVVAMDVESNPLMEAPEAPQPSPRESQAIAALRTRYGSFEGAFEEVSFARILARLHRIGATGRLFVTQGDIEKSIFFENGEPILVNSNREDELLGFFLLQRRIINQKELEEGLARLSEWGGRLGDALVAIGAIPAHEIFQHLSEQMREKILEVFSWGQGQYGYFENQQPQTHGYPLGIDTAATIVEGCLHRVAIDHIRAFYEERMHDRLGVSRSHGVALDDIPLNAKALRVAKAVGVSQTLEALFQRTSTFSNLGGTDSATEEFVLRVIYTLHQMEYFSFEQSGQVALPQS